MWHLRGWQAGIRLDTMETMKATASIAEQSPLPVGAILAAARARAGLSLRQLASRAGTSHATVLAYEKGSKVPSVATFLRLLDACDQAVDIELSPRIRRAEGLNRGEELEQALILAGQFPARHSSTLDLPRFGYKK
ncbi:helix-turn-helix transcriptional regulator [Proteobacteria bacterium 005FR1]|nr:helix-turn-helix transcriptional regulator [Proteobacteria bacterium 005FR1]